jgi:lysophospholipid acyltransferase (LPLAT)-like uncharacterized protein
MSHWPRLERFLVRWVGPWAVNTLYRSLRTEVLGGEPLESLRERYGATIYAGWHALFIGEVFPHRFTEGYLLVSEHGDAAMGSLIWGQLGYGFVRGSTTRGAVRALAQCVRLVRSGHDLGVTPDGPRGPRTVAQPGTIYIASKSGCPIVPMGFASSRYWEFHSWDRFRLPKPFARAVVQYGEPLLVPRDLSEDDVEAWRQRLTDGIRWATREAEKAVGLTPEEEEEGEEKTNDQQPTRNDQ